MVETFRGRGNGMPYFLDVAKTLCGFCVEAYLGEDSRGAEQIGEYYVNESPEVVESMSKHYDLRRLRKFSRNIGWTGRITIDRSHRGQGVGHELVKRMIRELEIRGGIHMEIFTREGLEKVKPILLREGYRAVEPRPDSSRWSSLVWRNYEL